MQAFHQTQKRYSKGEHSRTRKTFTRIRLTVGFHLIENYTVLSEDKDQLLIYTLFNKAIINSRLTKELDIKKIYS